MKVYTLIGGVNGVGKSSLTGVLMSSYNDLGTIVNPDNYAAEHGGNNYIAGKLAVRTIESCIERGVDLTQETTLSGRQPAATAKKAKEHGYYIRLFYVCINSLDECLGRIRNRVSKGGHDIPAETVGRRYEKRFADLARILPYCNEVRLFDNDNGFREAAEYRNGTLLIKTEAVPEWLTALKEYLSQNLI